MDDIWDTKNAFRARVTKIIKQQNDAVENIDELIGAVVFKIKEWI